MQFDFTEEERGALLRTVGSFRNGPYMVNAVYISPAQQLRNSADEMEQKECDYPLIQSVLRKLSEPRH